MQYADKYQGVEHWVAINILQPLASQILEGVTDYTIKATTTKYRGEILIVSNSMTPKETNTYALAELYEVKRLTNGKYLYKFRNVRKVIEFPCRNLTKKRGVWDCYMGEREVMEYPTHIDKTFVKRELAKSFNVKLDKDE